MIDHPPLNTCRGDLRPRRDEIEREAMEEKEKERETARRYSTGDVIERRPMGSARRSYLLVH